MNISDGLKRIVDNSKALYERCNEKDAEIARLTAALAAAEAAHLNSNRAEQTCRREFTQYADTNLKLISGYRGEVAGLKDEVERLKACGVMWANLQIQIADVRAAYERTKDQPRVLYDADRKPVMAASWRYLCDKVAAMLAAVEAPVPREHEKHADRLKAAVHERTGIASKDLKCPREKSFMTPCVARDGALAVLDDGRCVGCGASCRELLVQEGKATKCDVGTCQRPSLCADLIAAQSRIEDLEKAVKVLATIADAYDDNALDDEARKTWGANDEHRNTTPPEKIELYSGRGGNPGAKFGSPSPNDVAAREATLHTVVEWERAYNVPIPTGAIHPLVDRLLAFRAASPAAPISDERKAAEEVLSQWMRRCGPGTVVTVTDSERLTDALLAFLAARPHLAAISPASPALREAAARWLEAVVSLWAHKAEGIRIGPHDDQKCGITFPGDLSSVEWLRKNLLESLVDLLVSVGTLPSSPADPLLRELRDAVARCLAEGGLPVMPPSPLAGVVKAMESLRAAEDARPASGNPAR